MSSPNLEMSLKLSKGWSKIKLCYVILSQGLATENIKV